ncbi:MAG: tryptophan synthase subunit alpha [Sandaracinus sp.]|nr:tryptophan synthase subunit alpha [Myxococcales bacterium]MCB9625483.1 tryptophan synthase subunit alpha [Sandaracinus sp.]
MGRIAEAFATAADDNRAALVIYLCAGDPSLDATVELVVAAAEAGADVIELGVPFSDPTADGIAIQQASERSLARGTTMRGVLDVVRRVRERSAVPILLFGYYNPILHYGEAKLVADAKAAGVDGFLVVDLPPEEADPLVAPIREAGLGYVPLVAPTSTDSRVVQAAALASGFVYYVSMTGVTGAKDAVLDEAAARASELRGKVDAPVAVGFGIATADDARVVAAKADGVVVGSAIVRAIASASDVEGATAAVHALVSSLAAACRR